MAKKILLSAGGTAGHLFPALVLAQSLKEKNVDILFAASGLSQNSYFLQFCYPYQDIRSCSFRHVGGLGKKLKSLLKGVKQSYVLLKKYQPDLVVGFGSYHTFPLILASILLKIPYVLNEQNVLPGKVNRLFKPYSKSFLSHYPLKEKRALKEKKVAFPLRYKKQISYELKPLKQKLNLDLEKKTILIFGGSQGAQTINEIVLRSLIFFKNCGVQLIHLIGKQDQFFSYEKEYSERFLSPYVLRVFEPNMDELYQVADFVIARAGASTVHELIEFEKPALLIPYPYADHHQKHNADFFTLKVQGGVQCLEKDLTDSRFCDYIQKNLVDSSINQFTQNIKTWKNKQSAPSLAQQILLEMNL